MSVIKFEKKLFFKYLIFELRHFFDCFFWPICSLVSEKAGHSPFLLSYNLINNGFSSNELFLGFVTTVTTDFYNMFEIFVYLYILKDFCFLLKF